MDRESRGEVELGITAGPNSQKLVRQWSLSEKKHLRLNRPVRGSQGLCDFGLMGEQIVEDLRPRAEIGTATLVGAMTRLKSKDIAAHVVVERQSLV